MIKNLWQKSHGANGEKLFSEKISFSAILSESQKMKHQRHTPMPTAHTVWTFVCYASTFIVLVHRNLWKDCVPLTFRWKDSCRGHTSTNSAQVAVHSNFWMGQNAQDKANHKVSSATGRHWEWMPTVSSTEKCKCSKSMHFVCLWKDPNDVTYVSAIDSAVKTILLSQKKSLNVRSFLFPDFFPETKYGS